MPDWWDKTEEVGYAVSRQSRWGGLAVAVRGAVEVTNLA
jgi:hypothetical protein